MRYALLMHYGEPGEGEISEEAIAEAKEAFGAYGRALEDAGVLLSADVLQPSARSEERLVSLWENPAENAMEGGSIFPALGQEQQ